MDVAGIEKQTSVGKALQLLEVLGRLANHEDIRLADIVRETGLQKPTAHRLLAELKARDFVEQDRQSGRYRLGRKLMLLSAQLYGGIDLRERARPHLRALAERTGVTANLAVRDGIEVVYVDKIEGRAAVQLRSFIGWRGPLYCTALGKAVLAFDGEEVRHALWRTELKRLTPHTITDRAALEHELAQIRAQGYAVDEREHEAEVRCIAAPVFNHFGELVGAISVSGTVSQLTRAMVPEIGQLVRDRAEQISRSLGHGGGN
jgi:IclR family transcriptional regulator, KDG regulon repressor